VQAIADHSLAAGSGRASVKARSYCGETRGLLVTGWPSHVLIMRGAETDSHDFKSLYDMIQRPAAPLERLVLRFDDESNPSDYRAPTDDHIKEIVAFAKALEGHHSLWSCAPAATAGRRPPP
jgi:hypothetical protein